MKSREMAKIKARVIEEMRPYEVEPPAHFKTGKPKRITFKACYRKAASYLIDLPCPDAIRDKVKLVHGTYQHYATFRADHAWIELPGGIVFDGVLQRFYSLGDYYRVFKCEKEAEYEAKDVMAKIIEPNAHFGPWHK
jgi:hypothetical protein